jgi:hypothetical protein
MRTSKALIILSLLTGLLAVAQSGMGLFFQDGGSPFNFTTLHGQTVEIYGQGIYHFDTSFRAPIFKGTDAVTLFLCVPLLGIALVWYTRGSKRGRLFLTGVLAYLLYESASVTLGTAYNPMFLVYIASFSSSLFAFALAYTSIDTQDLADQFAAGRGLPRRGIAILLFVAGAALLFAWLTDLINWLAPGAMPGIASYTTEVTYAIDLGIIAPLAFLSGIQLLRRKPVSYLISAILLIMLAIIGVVVTTQTLFQMQAGITLSPGELIGKAGSFALLSLFAIGLLIRFFRGLGQEDNAPLTPLNTAQV